MLRGTILQSFESLSVLLSSHGNTFTTSSLENPHSQAKRTTESSSQQFHSLKQYTCFGPSVGHSFQRDSKSGRITSSPFLNVLKKSYSLDTVVEGPVAIDYRSVLGEEEFHHLSDDVLLHLLERLDEIGEDLQLEGFDADYSQGVLTVKLGSLGTYVLNKQTPNRQIWLSSPVSGPARFDWSSDTKKWIYRRTNEELLELLNNEFTKLLQTTVNFN